MSSWTHFIDTARAASSIDMEVYSAHIVLGEVLKVLHFLHTLQVTIFRSHCLLSIFLQRPAQQACSYRLFTVGALCKNRRPVRLFFGRKNFNSTRSRTFDRRLFSFQCGATRIRFEREINHRKDSNAYVTWHLLVLSCWFSLFKRFSTNSDFIWFKSCKSPLATHRLSELFGAPQRAFARFTGVNHFLTLEFSDASLSGVR